MRGLPGVTALAVLLAGCGSLSPSLPQVADRTVVGVSVARPAAGDAKPDAATEKALDFKVAQICTQGAALVRQDIESAERDWQLVDRQFRCAPYRFSLGLGGF